MVPRNNNPFRPILVGWSGFFIGMFDVTSKFLTALTYQFVPQERNDSKNERTNFKNQTKFN